jgi:ATP-binding cassette, subfamily B (MDR/TAP), member 1
LVSLTVEFFDKDENSTGGLTGSLSDNAQKINGLAGITLGTYVFPRVAQNLTHQSCSKSIIQSCSTVVTGLVLGFVFIWKLGFVAMGA